VTYGQENAVARIGQAADDLKRELIRDLPNGDARNAALVALAQTVQLAVAAVTAHRPAERMERNARPDPRHQGMLVQDRQ
jgi:hypothetical protein